MTTKLERAQAGVAAWKQPAAAAAGAPEEGE
jgi:hypothetical protein